MNAFIAAINRSWERLAFKLYRIPFFALVIFFSLLLCFFPQVFSKHSFIENSVIFVSAKLKGIRERQAEIALISVEDSLMYEWQKDVYKADQLSLLLANILHSSEARVGLLFDQAPIYEAQAIDVLAYQAQIDTGPIGQLVRQKLTLSEMLKDPRVVLGVQSGSMNSNTVIRVLPTNEFERYVFAAREALARLNRFESVEKSLDSNVSMAFGLGEIDSQTLSLWNTKGNELSGNYFSALCLIERILLRGPGDDEFVEEIGLFQSRAKQYACSKDKAAPVQPFVAVYDRLNSVHARTISLSLDEALALSTFPELVLLTRASDQDLNQQIADILHSLKYDQVLVEPWWSGWAQRVLFLTFVVYILFFAVKIESKKVKLGLALSAFFALYIVCAALAFFYAYLIPLTSLFVCTLLLAMLSSLRNIVRRDAIYQSTQLADAVSSSVNVLEASEAYEDAVTLLEHHPNRDFAAREIGNISSLLASNPETLSSAIALLESIHPKLKGHVLLREKLSSLRGDLSRTRTLQAAERKRPENDVELPKTLGRYQIERELGRGAVGIVYLGFDPAISRKVAVKTLDTRLFSKKQIKDLKQRFFREAEAVGRLNHPNIVSIYDLGEEGELAYIAMDYVEGVPLSEHILVEHLLPVAEVYRIVHDVASALAYAHEKQIVHRDIKPSNIMYGADSGVVKVADFGIARLLDNSRTATGEILGSPLYMAPEQLRGSKVDVRADIFSLGVTFYQLLTSHLPFDADNLAALTYEIIHNKHKNVRSIRKDLPASAARIVNQCLQKEPKDRYQSAHELVLVLRKAIKRDFPAMAESLSLV